MARNSAAWTAPDSCSLGQARRVLEEGLRQSDRRIAALESQVARMSETIAELKRDAVSLLELRQFGIQLNTAITKADECQIF
jgi:hypothetical protein